MKKIYSTVALVIVLSSMLWIPAVVLYWRSTIPGTPEKWIMSRGIVENGTHPVFNAVVVVYTDETWMEKGFTNVTGQFEIASPYPLNVTIPVECFVVATGFLDTAENQTLPTNLSVVSSNSNGIYYGYVDFQFSLLSEEI